MLAWSKLAKDAEKKTRRKERQKGEGMGEFGNEMALILAEVKTRRKEGEGRG